MSQLSAKRDASYITRRNAAAIVNANYNEALSNVNNRTVSYLKFQTRDNVSADLLQVQKLGCYTCTQNSNVNQKNAGSSFDANIIPQANGTFPTSGGVNNAGSS
jgi:hypothetical protein